MKISSLILVSATTVTCTAAFAGTQDIQSANSQLSIQAISTDVDYTENADTRSASGAGKVDTETGRVPGYAVSLSLMKNLWLGNDYARLQHSRSTGHTDYTGASISGGTFGSVTGQSGARMTDYNLRLGKGFEVHQEVMLTPFAEVGHHEWQRNVNQGETYTNNYAGIGVLAQYSPINRLVLTANALAGKTYGAKIDVAGSSGFSGALGNANLYRLGLSADYAFAKHWHANVGVDYTSFRYGASATYRASDGNFYYEPQSDTRYTTLSTGLGYSF